MDENFLNQKRESAAVQIPPQATRKHAKYPKTCGQYAADYGCTDRTIKSWVRTGKEKGDLPPLDDRLAMGLWLARYIPGKLASARQPSPNASSDVTPASHQSVSSSNPQPSSPPTPPRDFSNVRGLSIAENVEQLRRSLSIATELRDDALKGTDENMTALRQRNYKETFELLRKAEDTLAKLREQSGDLVDKENVRAEIAQALELLRLQRETMPRRIITELERILPRRLLRILRALEKFLTTAVNKARAEEENIFRNLESVTGPITAASSLSSPSS